MAVNAKAVVDIDINDKAFKTFQQAFEKFQKAVKQTPNDWAKFAAQNKEAATAFGKMSSELTKIGTESRKASAFMKDMANASNVIARHVRTAASSMKQFATHVKESTMNLLRWVGITGMIGGAFASITTLFGLTRLAGEARRERREAGGVGLSTGQQKALTMNFGGTVTGIEGMMGAVAEARRDRTSDAYAALRNLGISPGKGSAMDVNRELLRKVYERAQRGGNFGEWIRARNLGAAGISVSDMEMLSRMGRGEFEKKFAETGPAGVAKLGYTDKAAKQWSDFYDTMEKAGAKIKAALIDGLTPLMPYLTQLTDLFADWIREFFRGDSFKKLVEWVKGGLKSLTDYLGSQDFKDDIEAIKQAFRDLAKFLKRWFGPAPAGTGPGGGPAAPGTTGSSLSGTLGAPAGMNKEQFAAWFKQSRESQPGWANISSGAKERILTDRMEEAWGVYQTQQAGGGGSPRHGAGGRSRPAGGKTAAQRLGFDGGGGGGGSDVRISSAGYGGGMATMESDMAFFMSKGWTKEQAAGIVASIQHESGGIVGRFEGSTPGQPWKGGGPGRGLAQWTSPERKAAFFKQYGYQIGTRHDAQARMDELNFFQWELTHTERAAGDALRKAQTAGQAGDVVTRRFERPLYVDRDARTRAAAAEQIVKLQVTDHTGGNNTYTLAQAGGR